METLTGFKIAAFKAEIDRGYGDINLKGSCQRGRIQTWLLLNHSKTLWRLKAEKRVITYGKILRITTTELKFSCFQFVSMKVFSYSIFQNNQSAKNIKPIQENMNDVETEKTMKSKDV